MVFEENNLTYWRSGQTRMVYVVPGKPWVAKIMPSQASKLWRPDWLQNQVELQALQKLAHIHLSPKIIAYDANYQFTNSFGQSDVASVLIISRMGADLLEASKYLSKDQLYTSFRSVFWHLRAMLACGVLVPDVHPYNLAQVEEGALQAFPCDFGTTTDITPKNVHTMLKNFWRGLASVSLLRHSESLDEDCMYREVLRRSSHTWTTIDDGDFEFMDNFFLRKIQSAANASPPPPPSTQSHSATDRPVPGDSASSQSDRARQPHGTTPQASIGCFVRVCGLSRRTEFENQCGLVQELGGNRLTVRLEIGNAISVPHDNAVIVPQPRNAWLCSQAVKERHIGCLTQWQAGLNQGAKEAGSVLLAPRKPRLLQRLQYLSCLLLKKRSSRLVWQPLRLLTKPRLPGASLC
jgi:hypothetical protein